MSIFKRPGSKYYWFKFHFNGERVQRSSKATNIKDAKLAESEHYKKLLRGEFDALPKRSKSLSRGEKIKRRLRRARRSKTIRSAKNCLS